MPHPARLAAARLEDPVAIKRSFSRSNWIKERFGGQLDTLQRILAQIRMHKARTMFVEEIRIEDATDLREENEDLHTRFGVPLLSSEAYRLSFFKQWIGDPAALERVQAEDVLGYAIVKRDTDPWGGVRCRVYESVVRMNDHRNNYVRGRLPWAFAVAGHTLSVEGHLYAQQNGLTNCCAHVALRTAAALFHEEHDLSYREINRRLGIDHVTRRLGRTSQEDPEGEALGVEIPEMARVLEEIGANCDIGDYEELAALGPEEYRKEVSSLPAWQKHVYSSIESGYPAIIIFGTRKKGGHAIPVFGHTFNRDMWVPNAELFYFDAHKNTSYIPSDSWLSSFVCHDDNMGSNLCVPRHYLRVPPPKEEQRFPNLGADYVAGFIATRPKNVSITAIAAEAMARSILRLMLPSLPLEEDSAWVHVLRSAAADNENRIVLRTLLCEGNQYTAHLLELKDWQRNTADASVVAQIREELGEGKLWMVEISVPDLFSANLRKIGEILLSTEEPPPRAQNFPNFRLARIPGNFARHSGESEKLDFRYKPFPLLDHVQLYGCEDKDQDDESVILP